MLLGPCAYYVALEGRDTVAGSDAEFYVPFQVRHAPFLAGDYRR